VWCCMALWQLFPSCGCRNCTSFKFARHRVHNEVFRFKTVQRAPQIAYWQPAVHSVAGAHTMHSTHVLPPCNTDAHQRRDKLNGQALCLHRHKVTMEAMDIQVMQLEERTVGLSVSDTALCIV
jgi:hypothetical protein